MVSDHVGSGALSKSELKSPTLQDDFLCPTQKWPVPRVHARSGKYWRRLSLFLKIFGIQEPSGGQKSRRVSSGETD